jgi:gamma-glutamyltranspeptidase / glutathione hydrolase
VTARSLACPEPPAAEIATKAYEDGGTAVDAAIAAAFGQAVANPLGTGIGGMAHIMLLPAGAAKPVYLNASVETGSLASTKRFSSDFIGRSERAGRYLVRDDRNQWGYESIMTPGFVAGMDALRNAGAANLDWRRLVTPSAHLASEGFAVYPYLASYYTFEGPTRPGYPDIFHKLADNPIAKAIYMPEGRPRAAGSLLTQPDYGTTLRAIAEHGSREFYAGGIARRIAADLSKNASSVTEDDLAAYTVRSEMPVVGQFGDLTVYSAPPPSQGLILLTMLALAETLGLETADPLSPKYAETIAAITRTAFAECLPYIADPRFVEVPVNWLLSPERMAALRPDLDLPRSASVAMSDHTTHVSACDDDGNFVSITHSIGSVTGAGVMTPGLGFFYNNFLGHFNVMGGYHDSIAPGKRMGGGCPSIVFKKGQPWLAIGSSGGPRLISAVFQTLLNVTKFGMSLQEAVAAPRIHCEQARKIYAEPEFGTATLDTLRARGYDVVETNYMGCNQAVALFDGHAEAASDPRGGMGIVINDR